MFFRMRRTAVLLAATFALACEEDPVLVPSEPRICTREISPVTYEVYFVIDVSGSMGPFLTDVKNELLAFADGLPEHNADGKATEVEFFVVAFVNDVRWYPENVRRLREVSDVQRAFEDAIREGEDNLNLNAPTVNAETQENLLDALGAAIGNAPAADAVLLLVATDAGFEEAPDELSGGNAVQWTSPTVRSELERVGARVHACVRRHTAGLTRSYEGSASLTSLPGSTVHDITALTGARDRIRETLTVIAESADCN
jgi:hypothetical protein